jgi:hypothetical protein
MLYNNRGLMFVGEGNMSKAICPLRGHALTLRMWASLSLSLLQLNPAAVGNQATV